MRQESTLSTSPAPRRRRAQAGFTLIEWMASMIILGIAIISIISLQSTSLQTHIASEDTMVANGLADQFLEMLQTDSLRWRTSPNTMRYLNPSNTNTRMTTSSSVANAMWIPYTNRPVNFQLRDGTQGNSGTKARFCLFYKYSWAGTASGSGAGNGEVMEVNVVMLWPRNPGRLLKTYQTFFNTCGMTGTSPNYNLVRLYTEDINQQPVVRRNFRQVRRTTYVRRNLFGVGL